MYFTNHGVIRFKKKNFKDVLFDNFEKLVEDVNTSNFYIYIDLLIFDWLIITSKSSRKNVPIKKHLHYSSESRFSRYKNEKIGWFN